MFRLTVSSAALLLSMISLCGCGSQPTGGPSLGSQVDAAMKDPNPESRARALTKLGYQQYKARDFGGTDRTLEAASQACSEVKDLTSRASVYTLLGDAQARAGNTHDSGKSLEQARKAIEANDKTEIKAGQLAAIAEVEGLQLKDEAAARKTLEAARDLANKVEDAEGKVLALISVGSSYLEVKLPSEAAKLLAEAREAAQTVEDARKRGDLVASVAVAESKCSPETAPATFDIAIESAKQIENDYSKSFALSDIGAKLIAAGQAAKARTVLEEAEAAARKIKEPDLQKEAATKIDKTRAGLPPT